MELKTTEQENWSLIIRSQRAWWDLRLSELWHYRDLVWAFVWRDFVSTYKQTILGPFWHLVQPVITTLVFTIIFGNIAQLSTDGLPPFLFYMTGNTVWSYFAACLTSTADTFRGNAGIFGKVYFPRLITPVSIVISNFISFGIQFTLFLGFLIYFKLSGSLIYPNFWILALPILLLIMAGLGLGLGIIISSLTTKYRDLQKLVGFGTQLLMYGTPVIYPLSSVGEQWRWIIIANPMTPVVEVFRLAFLGVSTLSPAYLLYSIGFVFVVMLIGILIFNRVEATFMDTV